jgi:hypothetical protein
VHSTFCVDGVSTYKDEASATLILQVSSPALQDLVERLRAYIAKHAVWRFPPASMPANFHLTIAEEVPLRLEQQALEILSHFKLDPVCDVENPLLLRKESGYWATVRV